MILAIDPGVQQTGLAIVEYDKSMLYPLVVDAKTVVATDADQIANMVRKYKPTSIVIEKPFVARNWNMFGLVSYMIGLVVGHLVSIQDAYMVNIVFVSARTHTYILVGAKTRKQKEVKGKELWGDIIDSDHAACAAAIGVWYANKNREEV